MRTMKVVRLWTFLPRLAMHSVTFSTIYVQLSGFPTHFCFLKTSWTCPTSLVLTWCWVKLPMLFFQRSSATWQIVTARKEIGTSQEQWLWHYHFQAFLWCNGTYYLIGQIYSTSASSSLCFSAVGLLFRSRISRFYLSYQRRIRIVWSWTQCVIACQFSLILLFLDCHGWYCTFATEAQIVLEWMILTNFGWVRREKWRNDFNIYLKLNLTEHCNFCDNYRHHRHNHLSHFFVIQ